MCFEPAAIPPALPEGAALRSGSVDSSALILNGGGGDFSAYVSRAEVAADTAVIVLPDIRGLFDYYKNLTKALASAGHHAIAIDYFGRTAGTGSRSDEFDALSHIAQTTPEQVQQDIGAAVDYSRSDLGVSRVVTLGFCFGGSQSYLATTNSRLELDGAVAFYGGLDETRLNVFPSPKSKASEMKGPILALYGGADRSITTPMIEAFDAALSDHEVEHEFVVYDGAPHSFFDRRQEEFAADCDDAWRRVLKFLASN